MGLPGVPIVVLAALLVMPVGAPAPQTRSGATRIESHAFADDGGVWNPLGATLFWALWAEKHAPSKLDANLAFLSKGGVDYVRILGMVGSASWRDRQIEPADPDYWTTVDRLFARLARHHLRAQVTVFADAQVMMPDGAARRAFIDAWAVRANRHRAHVFALEVANEFWQNGFEGAEGIAELRALGQRLDAATTIPVALSSVPHTPGTWCRVYADAAADVVTIHYDRDVRTPAGAWGPVRAPWHYPGDFDEGCRGALPRAVISNEPIGPDSSVAEDHDPLRIALSYAMTFIAGNAAYVYHSGAGIRGGGAADLERGRATDFGNRDAPILAAIAAVRPHVPDGVANWTRHDATSAAFPWEGFQPAVGRGDLIGVYAASSDERIVAVLLGVRRAHVVTARRPMDVTLVHPVSGARSSTRTLARGATWTIPATSAGYLVIGTLR